MTITTERAQRIFDLRTALTRAQACHRRNDPNQVLFHVIDGAVSALEDDARLRVANAHAYPPSEPQEVSA